MYFVATGPMPGSIPSAAMRPAGQAASQQNINAVIERYQSALDIQSALTKVAFGVATIAAAVAVYKHYRCESIASDRELEVYRKGSVAPPPPVAPRYSYSPAYDGPYDVRRRYAY